VEDIFAIVGIFVVFPLILFHYITKWKTAKTLTGPDEQLLDDLYELSRRLDDRLCTIERIMNAENPNWRQNCLPSPDTEISALRERIGARGDRL
jgi:phage shock protein B